MKTLILALALGLLVLSFVPLFVDPYEHKTGVDFWIWANREFIEVKAGEKE